MPLDIGAVRAGIAANLATLDGLSRAHAFLPDSVSPPCAIVAWPEEQEFDLTFGRGTDQVAIPVLLLVGSVSDRKAQEKLDRWASGVTADAHPTGTPPQNVKWAVEADRELGGACDDARVVSARGYANYTVAGVEMLGVEFLIEVTG